ncbi:MAG TPA: alpha/beta fold hydrolase [Methylomirabilota bacterium]|nr:alpha/beta fold hydrolase [Methylomirabilota bacterium]
MSAEFEPHPLLKNPHLMTLAGTFWRRRFRLAPARERLFRVEEGTQIRGWCHWQPGEARDKPVLVLVHGLEGSSESGYMLGIAELAFRRGFHVVRLNQRNCGGSQQLTPTLYNSGLSGDYRAVLDQLANEDRFRAICFAGYSMGGNLVLKMEGELGGAAPAALRAVCAVCPAVDLAACATALEQRGNYIYQRHFVRSLMKNYTRKAALFPGRYARDGFGAVRTVREFDEKITAPCFGFRDAADYYERSSARSVLGRIRVETLVVAAQDDPFVPYAVTLAAGVQENPAITFEAPRHGGHCAFISRRGGSERFWAEKRIVEFCAAKCR